MQSLLGLLATAMFTFSTAHGQVDSGAGSTTADHGREVIGYVPQWDAWKGSSAGFPQQGILNQLNLDYSQYTMLNFSFLGVAEDGSLHSADLRNKQIYQEGVSQAPGQLLMTDIYSSWDYWILFGGIQPLWEVTPAAQAAGYEADGSGWKNDSLGTSSPQFPIPFQAAEGPKGLIELCQDNGVKAVASIGGWSMCKHFPETAADPVKRARFIADCQNLIAMGFDGIDLDWEFPGPFAGMNFTGSEADFENFTTLVTELREAIGPNKLITAAFNNSSVKLSGMEWRKLDGVMDYFNIMAYDYNGGWSNIAGHNSPLFSYTGQEGGPSSWHDTVNALASYGVDLNKVTMGMAFYGRGVQTAGMGGVNAPTVKTARNVQPDGPIVTAADFTSWPAFEGVPYHSRIVAQKSAWTEGWDDEAKVPFLAKEGAFLSYDDQRSIGLKSKYVRDNGLGGVIVWTAFGDLEPGDVDSGSTKLPRSSTTKAPLVKVVNEVLAGAAVPGETVGYLSAGSATTPEGDTGPNSLVIPVSLSAPMGFEVRVDFATVDGSAIAGSDYAATSGTLVFSPGEVAKSVTVPIFTDEEEEANETFSLGLSNPIGAELETPYVLGAIVDDDNLGGGVSIIPVVTLAGESVIEGDSGTTPLSITVSLDRAATEIVTVDYATEDDSANAGFDYVASSSQLVFSPGELSKAIQVDVIGDEDGEGDETFSMRLSNPVGVTLGASLVSVTIQDDDVTSTGGGPLVGLSALPQDRPVVMGYVNSLRSATGQDQTLTPAQVATEIDALHWEGYDAVVHAFAEPLGDGSIGESLGNFKIYQDDLLETAHENDVAVLLSLGGAYPARLATQFNTVAFDPVLRATFVDNVVDYVEAHGYDGVDIDWEFPDAGDGKAALTALMAELHADLKAENHDYIVMFGTGPGYYMGSYDFASLGSHCDYFFYFGYDWKSPHNGPISKPGSGPQWTTANDTLFEQSVRGGIEYVIDKGFPASKIICGLPFYGSGNASWSSVRNEYFANQASYDAAIDADAIEVLINGQWFTTPTALKLKMDALLDPSKSVLGGSAVIGGVGTWEIGHEHSSQPDLSLAFEEWMNGSTATPGPARISISDASSVESDGVMGFSLTLSRAAEELVRVDFATIAGTADAGSDYTEVSGSIEFSPGETSKSVSVPIVDDSADEPDETLAVNLTNVFGAATILRGSATGTIVDNDDIVLPPGEAEWTRHYQTGGGSGGGGDLSVGFITPTGGAVWGSGFSGALTLTNNGSDPVSEWTVEFDASWTTTGSGNAGGWTIENGHHTVVQPGWQGYELAAGQSVTIDFTGSGQWADPGNVVVNGASNGGGSNGNTTFSEWSSANGVTQALGDDDGDSSANIAEFLFATNPQQSNGFGVVTTSIEVLNGESRLVASFSVDPLAEGVEYRIESSEDNTTWSPSANVMTFLDSNPGTDGMLEVRWVSSLAVDSLSDLYVRLMARPVGTTGSGAVGAIGGEEDDPGGNGGNGGSGDVIWTRHYQLGSGSFEVSYTAPTGGLVWGSGFSGLIELSNTGETPVTEWTLQFDAPWTTTGSGNAGSWSIDSGRHTVTQPSWNGYTLAPGQSVSLDFTGSGTWAAPGNVTVDGQDPGSGATGNIVIDDWLSGFGLDSPSDDDDNDGMENLLEFLLGTDPVVADAGMLIGVETRSLTFDGATGDYVVISFEVETKAEGVEYTLQSSNDGTAWIDNTGEFVLHGETVQPSGLLQVEWRSTEPLENAASEQFVTLKVREVDDSGNGGTDGGGNSGGTGNQGSTGSPNVPTLSVQKDWVDGIGHTVEWNTWGGEPVTSWKLYCNDELVHSSEITGSAPQTDSYDLNSSVIGRFAYRVEVSNDSGSSTSTEVVYLSDFASPIGLIGLDAPSQVSQVTIQPGADSLHLEGGAEPYEVTVNHPAALSASVAGNTVSLNGTAGLRSGLKIEDAEGNVRLIGVRVETADGSLPELPPYLGVGSVSEDSTADLDFWADYQPGTDRNKWIDYRYIYINGGVKRKGVGWRTWTSVDGDRMRVFVRESIKRGMIPVVVWYNIPDGGESYTTDLEHMQDAEYMRGYYEDLKFAIDIANEEAGDELVVWLLEPDFIGYMAQNNEDPFTLTARTDAAYDVGALDTAAGDPLFPNTMRGLVESVNYTLKKHSNRCHIGWQFNLWAFPAGGWDASSQISGKGLIRVTDRDGYEDGRATIYREAELVADYYTSCGILTHGADFISIDKYGLDGGAEQKNDNPSESTWFWHAGHWANYLHYVDALNERTGKQVILWQLPVGHVNHSLKVSPYSGEVFPDHPNVPRDWEDSGPSFFFGDRFVPGAGARYDWFSDDGGGHADVTLEADGQTLEWGSRMEAARDAGVHVMLFGDGVGNSTRGRGAENTDEFWWISTVQDYYENPVLISP